jgi:hypothetical protein
VQLFFENAKYPKFWTSFYHGKSYAVALPKMGWAIFWRFFSKRIWSPCLRSPNESDRLPNRTQSTPDFKLKPILETFANVRASIFVPM